MEANSNYVIMIFENTQLGQANPRHLYASLTPPIANNILPNRPCKFFKNFISSFIILWNLFYIVLAEFHQFSHKFSKKVANSFVWQIPQNNWLYEASK